YAHRRCRCLDRGKPVLRDAFQHPHLHSMHRIVWSPRPRLPSAPFAPTSDAPGAHLVQCKGGEFLAHRRCPSARPVQNEREACRAEIGLKLITERRLCDSYMYEPYRTPAARCDLVCSSFGCSSALVG